MLTRRSPNGVVNGLALMFPMLLLSFNAPLMAEEYTDRFSRAVPFTTGGKVTIETHGGSVVFSGGDGGDVVVEATKKVDSDSREDADRLLDETEIDVRRSGNTLRIESKYSHEKRGLFARIFGQTFHDHVSIDYIVTLPGNTDVHVDATSTDVNGTDVEGRVSLDLTSGDVNLERIDGIVYVDGTSGNIVVKALGKDMSIDNTSGNVEAAGIAGDVEIDKTSGMVVLRDVGGNFFLDGTSCEVEASNIAGSAEIDVTSGDIVIGGLGGGILFEGTSGDLSVEFLESVTEPCEIGTSSGDVELIVEAVSNMDLFIGTDSGKISARLSNMEISEISENGLQAVVGSGGVKVRVETSSGDITIRQK